MEEKELCPKCQAELGEITETATGRKLQRCSKGSWNKETRANEGCNYVKWLPIEPQILEEKCPECGESLILFTTNNGKSMKKCSTAGWDRNSKKATGCTFIEWQKNLPPPPEEN